jgi:hypothetical protein
VTEALDVPIRSSAIVNVLAPAAVAKADRARPISKFFVTI